MLRPDLIERLIVLNIYHPKVFSQLLATPEQRKKSWYFFMFQCPLVPHMYLKAQDYIYIDRIYRSEEAGIRNTKNFTDEDLEAFKYNFSQPGNFIKEAFYKSKIFYFFSFPDDFFKIGDIFRN